MSNMDERIEFIRNRVPKAARYEQLAEECAELCHASLKMARILRGENPTPVHYGQAMDAVVEELSDVFTAAEVVGVCVDVATIDNKVTRWVERLEGERGLYDA